MFYVSGIKEYTLYINDLFKSSWKLQGNPKHLTVFVSHHGRHNHFWTIMYYELHYWVFHIV